jgi:hypothetical protein
VMEQIEVWRHGEELSCHLRGMRCD